MGMWQLDWGMGEARGLTFTGHLPPFSAWCWQVPLSDTPFHEVTPPILSFPKRFFLRRPCVCPRTMLGMGAVPPQPSQSVNKCSAIRSERVGAGAKTSLSKGDCLAYNFLGFQ